MQERERKIISMMYNSEISYALDGVFHNSLGIDCIYFTEDTERYPNDPIAGENVYIKLLTWPQETGQSTWITWKKNNVDQTPIGGDWKYNSGNNTYWEVAIGSFVKGDYIEYTIHANKDGRNEKTDGPFDFTVTDWEYLIKISNYSDKTNHIELSGQANTGSFIPKLNITFIADDIFRVQMSPKGNVLTDIGIANYTVIDKFTYIEVKTLKLELRIKKDPYKLSVYDLNGILIAKEYDSTINRNMAWLTDGNNIIDKVEENFYTPTTEEFYGFGEHFNNFSKRGQNVDTYIYNQYKNQNEKTYLSIPFLINSRGYGIYNNSTYYSQFRLATDRSDMYGFTTKTGGKKDATLDYYFIYGDNLDDVVSNYTEVTIKPVLPPKWAFGLWMSANEWDRQSEVTNALAMADKYDIPANVIVLEQWSDESTFYIFNDAQYTPNNGSVALGYTDYTFPSNGKWPDPKSLVQDIHNAGMKVLLWQVPIEKYIRSGHTQKDNDEIYMINNNYAVSDGNGGQYRLPEGKWFSNSLLVDFTNPSAVSWWLDKRAYMLDDLKIDGFKTDGGEMVWGRDVTFFDGRKGDEIRNIYPNLYYGSYYDFAASKRSESMTFSRSGTGGAQKYPGFWSGDMESNFYALGQALTAGLTANMSGVPFWGWDLAGFTGNFPTAELFKRSTEMSVFTPIIQFHSEKSNPSVSEERSPWNVALRTKDNSVLINFRRYMNIRMNLMPYIYSEATKTSITGVPMMRAMVLEAPKDINTYKLNEQYMFGESLLIAPIINKGQTRKTIYLPDGEWIDFFYGSQRPGGQTITYYADVDTIPVFVKQGSILPMNLNKDYELGGSIGNDLEAYINLVFRVYPYGNSSYQWNDDIGGGIKTISVAEDYNNNKVTVILAEINQKKTLQVYTTKPSNVTVEGRALNEQVTLANLKTEKDGWFYDSTSLITYVKLASHIGIKTVVLNGVSKNSYEAEYATQVNVSTNTNHSGYTGTGFVDQFTEKGDAVVFEVNTDAAGRYDVDFRYSAGKNQASRSIYVNSTKIVDVILPKTADWDTWNSVTQSLELVKGKNLIALQYDSGNSEGINLDNIVLRMNSSVVDKLGDFLSASINGDTLTLIVDNGTLSNDDILELQVCDEDILKVNYLANGITASEDTPILDPNKVWNTVGARINIEGDPITITTSKMKIEISKSPVRLTVKKADGTELFYEPLSGGVNNESIRFVRSGTDDLYGGHGYDFLGGSGELLRNDTTQIMDAGYQGDAGAPFLWSTSGYGILLDADGAYPVTETASKKLEMYYGDFDKRRYKKNDIEYFVIVNDPKGIMNSIGEISGKAPMLPKWALGFMNTEWGIDETEMMNDVDTYRAKNIPIDSYSIDYDWKKWGENNYGEFNWNTKNFPSAATTSLKTAMDGKGIKMIGIMKPRIVVETSDGTLTTQAMAAEAGGYWYPGGRQYNDYFKSIPVRDLDFYNPECRLWYFNNLKGAIDKGISGFWNDELGRVQAGSYDFMFGPFQGLHMQQAIYEGQRQYSNKRVFSTNRNFYLGAQRYAYTTWSGDIGTYFSNPNADVGMQEQRERMLSTINLGQSKWGMDTGGFNPSSAEPSPELYAKWMQFSAFTPIFRVHGNMNHQRQPWYYGSTAEEVAKYAIRLRYKLMPYIYSYEWNDYKNGVGLVRPLIFDYPNDPNVKNHVLSWMFGDYMLVSPVLEETDASMDIYLPEGIWIDYFRGQEYVGKQTISYEIDGETWTDIPIFIKKGAIIPSHKALDYEKQSLIDTIDLDIFPSISKTYFNFYDDDGNNYDYENGVYFEQVIYAQDKGVNGYELVIDGKNGMYNSDVNYYMAKIHGKAGSSVILDGTALTEYTDYNALKANDGQGFAVSRDIYGYVTYVKVGAGSESDKVIVIAGNETVNASTMKYEAENSSLSGDTIRTKAIANTNHKNYSGSGFVDGFNNTGAEATFYIDVKHSGDYGINLRYSNGNGIDKKISIFVNGVRVKQSILGATANWDTWSSKTENLPLTAGNNIITYKYYSDGGDSGDVNLDYIKVAFEPLLIKIEAESSKLSGGTNINQNHYYYSGTGFIEGFNNVGASSKFEVDVDRSGSYKLNLKYANGSGTTKNLSVYINGIDVGDINLISNSANWNKWETKEYIVNLVYGKNNVEFKYKSSNSENVNLDRLLVSHNTVGIIESEVNILDNGGFERNISQSSAWTEWHPYGQTIAWGVDDGTSIVPIESAWTGNNRAYIHSNSPYEQSIKQGNSVANGAYKVEAWVKMTNVTPIVGRMEVTNYGGSNLTYNINNDGMWKYIVLDDVNVTNGYIEVGFYVKSPGNTTLLIDNVILTKK